MDHSAETSGGGGGATATHACDVCGARATLQCQSCLSAYYCSEEHLRQDRLAGHQHTCYQYNAAATTTTKIQSSLSSTGSGGSGSVVRALHELSHTRGVRVGNTVDELVVASDGGDERTRQNLLQHFYALLDVASGAMHGITVDAVYAASVNALLAVVQTARRIVDVSLEHSRALLTLIARHIVDALNALKSMLFSTGGGITTSVEVDAQQQQQQLSELGSEMNECATLMQGASDIAVRLMRQAVQWLLAPFTWLGERVEQAVRFAASLFANTADTAALVAEEVRETLAKRKAAAQRLRRQMPDIGELSGALLDRLSAFTVFCMQAPAATPVLLETSTQLSNEYLSEQLAALVPEIAALWQRFLAPAWDATVNNAWARSIRRQLDGLVKSAWFLEFKHMLRGALDDAVELPRLVTRALAWLCNALNLHALLLRPLVDQVVFRAGGRLFARVCTGTEAWARQVRERLMGGGGGADAQSSSPPSFMDEDGIPMSDYRPRAVAMVQLALQVCETYTPQRLGVDAERLDELAQQYAELVRDMRAQEKRVQQMRRDMGVRRFASELVTAQWRFARASAPLMRGRDVGSAPDNATEAASEAGDPRARELLEASTVLYRLLNGSDEQQYMDGQTKAHETIAVAHHFLSTLIVPLQRIANELTQQAHRTLQAVNTPIDTSSSVAAAANVEHIGPNYDSSSALVLTGGGEQNALQSYEALIAQATQANAVAAQLAQQTSRTVVASTLLQALGAGVRLHSVHSRMTDAQKQRLADIREWVRRCRARAFNIAVYGGVLLVVVRIVFQRLSLGALPIDALLTDTTQVELEDATRTRVLLLSAFLEDGARVAQEWKTATTSTLSHSIPVERLRNGFMQTLYAELKHADSKQYHSDAATAELLRKEAIDALLSPFTGIELDANRHARANSAGSFLSESRVSALVTRYIGNEQFYRSLAKSKGVFLDVSLQGRYVHLDSALGGGGGAPTTQRIGSAVVEEWIRLRDLFSNPSAGGADEEARKRVRDMESEQLITAGARGNEVLTGWWNTLARRLAWQSFSELSGMQMQMDAVRVLAGSSLEIYEHKSSSNGDGTNAQQQQQQGGSSSGGDSGMFSFFGNGVRGIQRWAFGTTVAIAETVRAFITAFLRLASEPVLRAYDLLKNDIAHAFTGWMNPVYQLATFASRVLLVIDIYQTIRDVFISLYMQRRRDELVGTSEVELTPVDWVGFLSPVGQRVFGFVSHNATRFVLLESAPYALVASLVFGAVRVLCGWAPYGASSVTNAVWLGGHSLLKSFSLSSDSLRRDATAKGLHRAGIPLDIAQTMADIYHQLDNHDSAAADTSAAAGFTNMFGARFNHLSSSASSSTRRTSPYQEATVTTPLNFGFTTSARRLTPPPSTTTTVEEVFGDEDDNELPSAASAASQ